MEVGQECIIMKAIVGTTGIYNKVGESKGNFALYDATCPPPPASTPVVKSSAQCNVPFNNMGGPSVNTYETAIIESFYTADMAACKAKCDFLSGYCASYSFYGNTCTIASVTIEAPGAYDDMGETDNILGYASDAGC